MAEGHKHQFKDRKEKIGWYLDEIDSYKEDMGKWYSLFIRIILPFLLFIIPINIVGARVYKSVVNRYLSGILDPNDNAAMIAFWLISLLIFLAILIFLPRFATFCEFAISGVFYYIALFLPVTTVSNGVIVVKPLITNGLGYFVVIALSVFMFMKLVFLVLEIMYRIVFRGEKEPKAYKDDQDDIVF
jgi:hypothetical protein